MVRALVILANGFEETEALAPADLLRRAGAEVTLAGLDSITVCSSHKIAVTCDSLLDEVSSTEYDAVILPGGMPGASNLASCKTVSDIVLKTYSRGSIVAAICASPALVLGPLGILEGKKATCYPGMEEHSPAVSFSDERVVKDRNVITSRGMGCSIEFGLEIVQALFGIEVRENLARKIIFGGNR